MGASGVRGRRCPDCRRQWPQPDAWFCGACGSILAEHRSRTDDRSTRTAGRVVVATALAGLLVLAGTADLSREHALEAPEVEVRDGIATATNPLTPDEVAQLREQAESDQLRCVPRGCELWRYDRAWAPMATGAVELAEDAVLVLLGEPPGSRQRRGTTNVTADDEDGADDDGADDDGADEDGGPALDGGVAAEPPPQHRLVAIDTGSGTERWSRPVSEYRTISGAYRWVRLLPGPDGGALIVAGTTVTAIDRDGEKLWTAAAADRNRAEVHDIFDARTAADVVLLASTSLDRSRSDRHLLAVDARSGTMRWAADVSHVVALRDDHAVVLDPDGTLRRLDAATGESEWSRRGAVTYARDAGPWLAVQEGGSLYLVDPHSGADITTVDGWLTSTLVAAGDRWLGTLREPSVDVDVSLWDDQAGPMSVVAFADDGALDWTAPLGSLHPWSDCCPIRVDVDEGRVTVLDPVRALHHDLETGRLLDVDVIRGASDRSRDGRGLADAPVHHPELGIQVAYSGDGQRLDIHTPDGWVTVRSSTTLRLESLDPLVVTDGREVVGLVTGR